MKTNSNENVSVFQSHLQRIIPVNDEEFDYILSYFSVKHLKKKDYLVRPFQVCKYESYILKGLFQTAILDDSGRLHTLYFPHEDWWVSDFKSFKKEEESRMEIIALEDAVLLQISKPNLEALYLSFPKFERFFRILNENAGIALQDRIIQNFSKDAENKYAEFRAKYPELQQRISQKRIAAYLGITPEYFSQMSKKKESAKS
ncbi:Crp/Fnr family transcriptional regulator [Runella sp.]|uniref:Crp/Fnr family transcriptional regulator n=1 Tax=Runella sp. TaxID=1960881 RepID=UPI003D14E6D7